MLYCGCPFCRLCSNFCKRKFDFILLNSLSWYICFIVLKIILFIYLTVWDLRWGFSGGSRGKRICLPVQEMQQMRVRSLGQEEPLEWDLGNGSKEMATHSSILAWRIPWTEVPGELQSMGLQRVRHNWGRVCASAHTYTHTLTHAGLSCSTQDLHHIMWNHFAVAHRLSSCGMGA